MAGDAGKGSGRRPRQISREEEDLRWAYYKGYITIKEFSRKLKQIRKKHAST